MLLLQHGASPHSTTRDLYTPLHIAAKEGQEEVNFPRLYQFYFWDEVIYITLLL